MRLAAPLGDRLGEVGEEHGEPEPKDDLELEADASPSREQVAHEDDGGQRGDHLEDEHHRVLEEGPRVELDEGRTDRRPHDLGIEQGRDGHLLAQGGGRHEGNSECPG